MESAIEFKSLGSNTTINNLQKLASDFSHLQKLEEKGFILDTSKQTLIKPAKTGNFAEDLIEEVCSL